MNLAHVILLRLHHYHFLSSNLLPLMIRGAKSSAVNSVLENLVERGYARKLGRTSCSEADEFRGTWYCPSGKSPEAFWGNDGMPEWGNRRTYVHIRSSAAIRGLSSDVRIGDSYVSRHRLKTAVIAASIFEKRLPGLGVVSEVYLRRVLNWYFAGLPCADKGIKHAPVRHPVPDLLVWNSGKQQLGVELERTIKAVSAYREYALHHQNKFPVLWLTETQRDTDRLQKLFREIEDTREFTVLPVGQGVQWIADSFYS